MDLDEAFRIAIKQYFKGKEPEGLKGTAGKRRKYDKKYFDRIENEHFGSKTDPEKEGKK